MIEHVETQVLLVLLVASLVGMGARLLRLPYTLALVLAGLGLGMGNFETLASLRLTPELVLLLLLPPLLFEAAFHLSLQDLRRNAAPILLLAGPGVLLATALTAGLLVPLAGLVGAEVPWRAAWLFGALIAATDPISVLALFKTLGVPRRLYVLVEGESLLNDGVAVVVFGIVLVLVGLPPLHGEPVVLAGTAEALAYGLVRFVQMALGGVLVGVVLGGLASALTATVEDHLVEITLTTVVAYGSFLVAETLHTSGVLATVAAGITLGSVGARYGMGAGTRLAVADFWHYLAFLANSFIFLLIGLELDPAALARVALPVLAAFVAVLAGRVLAVHLTLEVAARLGNPVPRPWRHVMAWGGLRGSLSMVLVLALPEEAPARDVLVHLVFGVVALSLFLQGLTMKPLLGRLGLLGGGDADWAAYERARAETVVAARVLEEAAAMVRRGRLDPELHASLLQHYRERRAGAEERAVRLAGRAANAARQAEAWLALLDVEREAIHELERAGTLAPEVAAALLAANGLRKADLTAALHAGEDALRSLLARELGGSGREGGHDAKDEEA